MIRGLVILAALLFLPTAAHATGPLCCGGSGGGSGSSAFDALTGGTNTSAAMVVGTGASLSTSGSGTIAATSSTALAANPTDCAANTYATTIDASGNLTCASVTNASTTGTALNTPSTLVLRDGSGNFAAGTITAALSGNSTTATALAANGSNCSAGQAAAGVSASGAAEGCATYLTAEVDGSTTNELQNIFQTVSTSSGTSPVADTTTDTLTLTGTAPVTVTGDSTGDSVTLALADVTDCSANQFVTGSGANLALVCAQPAFSNLSGSATDAQIPDTITASNYLPLAGGTVTGNVTIQGLLDLGDDVPDQTTGNATILDISPTVDITGTAGSLYGSLFAPSTTMSGSTETMVAHRLAPVISVSGTSPLISGMNFAGTITYSNTTDPMPVYQVNAAVFAPTLTSSGGNGSLYQDAYVDQSTIQYTGAGDMTDVSSATGNPWAPISFLSNYLIKTTGAGDYSINDSFGLHFKPQFSTNNNATAITVTDLEALNAIVPTHTRVSGTGTATVTNYSVAHGEFDDALNAGLAITNAYGLRLTNWNKATNNYTIYSDAAASMYHGGVVDLGDAIADLSSGTTSVVDIAPTVDQSGGTLNGLYFAPTTALSGILTSTKGLAIIPTISHNVTTIGALIYGVSMEGTMTSTGATALATASILNHAATYTTSTANAEPFTTLVALVNTPTVSYTAASGTGTPTTSITAQHNPTYSTTASGGAMTLASDVGFQVDGTLSAASGSTATITTRTGVKVNDITLSGTGTKTVTTNVAIDIAALANGTNPIGLRNADTTVYTPCVDDISGNTDYMAAKTACTAINLTAGGARDFTAGTDQIADGYDGQIVYLFFTGSNSVKFDDGDNVNLDAAGAVTLSAGDTLTLLFSSTRGEWMELGRRDN